MATYQYLKQSDFLTLLAARLYDPNEQFWSHAEKALYLAEALRTWNALTAMWRSDFIIPTTQASRWYDISGTAQAGVVAAAATTRPLTLTDRDIYTLLQYALLEPVAWNPWAGASSQFSAADLTAAVQARRDELLSITGAFITYRQVGAVAGRITLPDSVIDVRRMAYLPLAAFNQPNSAMWPEDAWAEQSFNRLYTTQAAGTPLTYLMSSQPPLVFDTDRPPAYAGNYEILSVDAGLATSPQIPTPLIVPDDWTHIIKYGALATLLGRESVAHDALRQKYAEQRYQLGAKLLTDAPALLAARIANVPVQVDAVRHADTYRTGWEAESPATPNAIYTAGLNLIAVAPVPDAGPYSITATVVGNAPIPASDADFVQVARDDLDALLDYAVHVAMFKSGGSEFSDTLPLFTRFMSQAALYNRKLAEMGDLTPMLLGTSQMEAGAAPRMTPEEASA